ncbi:LOW QUALITY PROTEIN: C2 calcium-dependent domain-containing protein 6-like [Carlito syrichta]|uniref:LOW QUALITY PROTEIN: C2 calcium-dependent domain-containing protein 6-like n=1 Tax=Carlito syrichta TaxID=1868482 RepID=A0A3Q0EFW6_CARSF|nr:LOW QUALITY PROTEIN: C2 calcium-dependent domain-containing protein 6-like [Carlito syrichta]
MCPEEHKRRPTPPCQRWQPNGRARQAPHLQSQRPRRPGLSGSIQAAREKRRDVGRPRLRSGGPSVGRTQAAEDGAMESPGEPGAPSNPADSRGGRVSAQFTAPLLQRNPYSSLDVVHKRGYEVPLVHHAQDPSKTTKPKDKGQHGTGHRLLEMLRKTLEGTESEELETVQEKPNLVPFGDVVGCLAVHVKTCRHFAPKISLHYTNLFIRISINKVVKSTKTCSLISGNNEKNIAIKFDEVKYFSVQVPRRHDDERNNVFLELMQYDDTEKYPLILGRVQIHLYKIIQKGCFTEEFQIWNKNTFICRLVVEFMFSYGNFGYGFSHQLKPLQKIVEPSMFMNIAPPPERTDPMTNVILPQTVEYPAFLSPDLNVAVGAPTVQTTDQPTVVRLEKLQQQPRERLEKMKKEYRNLNTWMEKSDYLENILAPKLRHKDSKETDMNEVPESPNNDQSEKKFETFVTLEVPIINKKTKTTPNELLDNDDKKDLTIPTQNQSDQDNSAAVTPKSDESTPPPTNSPLPTLPRPEKTEAGKIPPLDEYQTEDTPDRKMKNYVLFPPEVKLKDKYPSILKTSPTEVKLRNICISPKRLRRRNLEPSPTEISWHSSCLNLAERTSTCLASPDSILKSGFQKQDPKEDLAQRRLATILELYIGKQNNLFLKIKYK